MVTNIEGLKVKGRMYSTETELMFWGKQGNKNARLSLLYGKNGSGKSTISDAFQCVKQSDNLDFEHISLISSGILTEADKKCIHVFNERFIDSNIKIAGDGLDSIIMFGKQVDIDTQIGTKTKEYEEKSQEEKLQTELVAEYDDNTNDKSSVYHMNKCIDILKTQGWAHEDSQLKGNRQNTSVNSTVVENIMNNYSSEKSQVELETEYLEDKTNFDAVRNISSEISAKVPFFDYNGVDLSAKMILCKKIEKSELTDREKKIFSFIEGRGQALLSSSKLFFSEEGSNYCPYCYQSVSNEYKQHLMQEFRNVLNKEVEAYQDELEKLKQIELTVDLEPYSQLDRTTVQSVQIKLNEFNQQLRQYNAQIDGRKNNVYQIFTETDYKISIEDAIKPLNNALKELENKRIEFNELVKGKDKLKKKLLKLNSQMANKKITAHFEKYNLWHGQQEIEKKKLENLTLERKNLERFIQSLEDQKKNIKIAQEHINYLLQYVFFSKGKLSIETKDGIYVVRSNGQSVKPNQISCGERNILALCYYFTELFAGKEKEKMYSNPHLLIIDDPVSSFDRENRVGVLSLLKYELQSFIYGNTDTKVLIMTHDLMAFYDLEKVMREITKGKNFVYGLHEIVDRKIQSFSFNKGNEYTKLLCAIYDFSQNDTPSDYMKLTIGNTIRKVLEAYSTFVYKVGIDEVSFNEQILQEIPSESKRTYFSNLMYRIVLNGESHLEERVKALEDFCNGISDDEKNRIAKDVLCFLYLLNPVHVEQHLTECSGAIEQINKWCEDIETI